MHDIVIDVCNVTSKERNANLLRVRWVALSETKVLASGSDCCEDLLAEGLVAFVFGKIELYILISCCIMRFWTLNELTVKASMRTWKSVLVAVVTVDVEPTEPIHALEFLEAVERYLACSGNELQQLGTLFLVV